MSDPLYKKEVLRLAADATGAGRLNEPHGSATAHNPACGDKVTVEVALEDGRIAAIAHETRACVLTQASATIIGGDAIGLSKSEVMALRANVESMLKGSDGQPLAPFDTYGVFDGVIGYRNRHTCVLLPIDALIKAIDDSETTEPRR